MIFMYIYIYSLDKLVTSLFKKIVESVLTSPFFIKSMMQNQIKLFIIFRKSIISIYIYIYLFYIYMRRYFVALEAHLAHF